MRKHRAANGLAQSVEQDRESNKGEAMTVFDPRVLVGKARRSIRRRGWRGTLVEATTRFKRSRTRRLRRYVRELVFDLRNGTRTRGIVKHEKRGVFEQAFRCETTPRSWLVEALSEVAANPAHYTFIDIGCGRGFVLLNALKRRYKRIIGIELAPQIAAEAAANVDAYGRRHGLSRTVEIVVGDATTWDLPSEPSIIYLCNPFSREIFERMERRIEESLECDPRDVYVIYVFPESREVFDDSPAFDTISSRKHYVVYRSKPSLGKVIVPSHNASLRAGEPLAPVATRAGRRGVPGAFGFE